MSRSSNNNNNNLLASSRSTPTASNKASTTASTFSTFSAINPTREVAVGSKRTFTFRRRSYSTNKLYSQMFTVAAATTADGTKRRQRQAPSPSSVRGGGGGAAAAAHTLKRAAHSHASLLNLMPLQGQQATAAVLPVCSLRPATAKGRVAVDTEQQATVTPAENSIERDELDLLCAAEHGLAQQVMSIVERQKRNCTVVVNCQDFMGRTPIMLAAVNEHFDCLDILIRKCSPQRVLEALLACIAQDLTEMSQFIIKHPVYEVDKVGARIILGESSDIFYNRSGEDSLQYSSDITPVILAAQKQHVETLKLLLDRGARIERPHKITCSCTECRNRAKYDSLKHSRSRLNAYRGLTSPSYIALTAKDAITEAFRLSGELRLLSGVEKEFKAQYIELSEQCEKFAVELLDHCRNTLEVRTVLNGQEPPSSTTITTKEIEEEVEHGTSDAGERQRQQELEKNNLSLLNLAFRYNQKSFIAHASCQQQVGIFWCAGFSSWRRRAWWQRAAFVSISLIFFPFITLAYVLLLAPLSCYGEERSRRGSGGIFFLCGAAKKLTTMPLLKFTMHVASDLYFVVLLIALGWGKSFDDEYEEEDDDLFRERQMNCALSFTIMVERYLLVAWSVGQALNIVKRLRHKAFVDFLSGWWNYVELLACVVLLVAHVLIFVNTQFYYAEQQTTQPFSSCQALRTQVSFTTKQTYNCLLSFAAILTFMRVTMTLFQASESFGPLQISLGRLVPEIAKYIFVFVILITSFNIALMMIFGEYHHHRSQQQQYQQQLQQNAFQFFDQHHHPFNANLVDEHGAVIPNTYQVVLGTTRRSARGAGGGGGRANAGEWISDEFSSISGTFRSLFWSLFGMSPRESAELRAQFQNHYPRHHEAKADDGVDFRESQTAAPYPRFAEYAGNFLFGSFHVLSIILINILIAALAWGYTEIREDEDTEWKYARTKLRLSYIEQKSFTQPPFNILSSALDVLLFVGAKACNFLPSARIILQPLQKIWKRRRHSIAGVTRRSVVNRASFASATKPHIQISTNELNGGHTMRPPPAAAAATSRLVLAAINTMRNNNKQQKEVQKNLSPYESLMVRLTTRWMHYKFYKNAAPQLPPPATTVVQQQHIDTVGDHPVVVSSRSSRRPSSLANANLNEKLSQTLAELERLRTKVDETHKVLSISHAGSTNNLTVPTRHRTWDSASSQSISAEQQQHLYAPEVLFITTRDSTASSGQINRSFIDDEDEETVM